MDALEASTIQSVHFLSLRHVSIEFVETRTRRIRVRHLTILDNDILSWRRLSVYEDNRESDLEITLAKPVDALDAVIRYSETRIRGTSYENSVSIVR